MFYTLTINNKDYRLKLTTRNIITLEKLLGCNPIAIFGEGDRIPTITEMVQIFYASLQQLHHGISLNDAYDIFDEYLEEHSATEFIPVILEIYRASGLIGKEEEKN